MLWPPSGGGTPRGGPIVLEEVDGIVGNPAGREVGATAATIGVDALLPVCFAPADHADPSLGRADPVSDSRRGIASFRGKSLRGNRRRDLCAVVYQALDVTVHRAPRVWELSTSLPVRQKRSVTVSSPKLCAQCRRFWKVRFLTQVAATTLEVPINTEPGKPTRCRHRVGTGASRHAAPHPRPANG